MPRSRSTVKPAASDLWTATNGGNAVGAQIGGLLAFNGRFYAADLGNGNVYVSADGSSWSAGMAVGSQINSLETYNGRLYAGDYANAG